MSGSDEKEDVDTTNIYVLNVRVKSVNHLRTHLGDLNRGKKHKTNPLCQVSFKDPHTGCAYVWRTSPIFDDVNPQWNESNSWPLFFSPPDDLQINFMIMDAGDSTTPADLIGNASLKFNELDGSPKALVGKKCKKTTTITVEATKKKLVTVPDNFVKKVNEKLKKVDDGKAHNVDKKLANYADLETVKELNATVNQLQSSVRNKYGKVQLMKKLEGYATTEMVNKLQMTIQKIQADNILNHGKFVKKDEMNTDFVKKEQYDALQRNLEKMQKEYETKLKQLADRLDKKVNGITNKLDGMKKVLSD